MATGNWRARFFGAVLACIAASSSSAQDMSVWIGQFEADEKSLAHRYRTPLESDSTAVRDVLLRGWQEKLAGCDFESLDRANQIDFLLLRSEIDYRHAKQRIDRARDRDAAQLLPYHKELVEFCRAREEVERQAPADVAKMLDAAAELAEQTTQDLKQLPKEDQDSETVKLRLRALRACELIREIAGRLSEADGFYRGYDPSYTWWTEKPVERLKSALTKHRTALRNKVVGVPDSDTETIIGLPIGSEGLQLELEHEWIAHSPSELVAIARREMAWCDNEMAKASQELGFGDDWRAAMTHVKSKHVAPGDQPQMIKDLAWEAIRFLESHDLVTVPPLAANGWRMTMMSPARQRVNPYFLGGDSIIVSFPTNTMTHAEKLMSMRSNNEHFSRATVHHELIPGHHLQHYMLPRYRPYRSMFSTPFWIEGWALYWEMLLWDLEFAQSAEDRVGMLFWRKHRCARIIFSLGYHLGEMSPGECVDYLVERVGHERSAATAEVRRSIMGGYSPLYQAAYMLGGLQIRRMHEDSVQTGRQTNRQFHDAILQEHAMPIEVLRLALGDQPLRKDQEPEWKFAD